MILGIGTDLLEIGRIARVLEQHGERFSQRVLTTAEQKECQARASAVNYMAKQFAAKEAIAKALGVGIGAALSFQDIEIIRNPQGKPCVILSDGAKARFNQPGVHLSLTDTKETVMAFCVVEIA